MAHTKSAIKRLGTSKKANLRNRARISELTEHLRNNKKDNSTRRGLLAMVALRKRLLAYLERENVERYLSLTTELGIRRASK